MKKGLAIIASSILIFPSIANATTIEHLMQMHGKEAIMKTIAPKISKRFTIFLDGTMKEVPSPNPDYITASTLLIDIERAGMSVKSVEKSILEQVEKKHAEEEQKEKYDDELRSWVSKQNQNANKKEYEDRKLLTEASQEEREQFRVAEQRGRLLSAIQLKAQRQQQAIAAESSNPFSTISRDQAENDLKAMLLSKYVNNYSLIEMLLKSGMNAFDELASIPDSPIDNAILKKQHKKYYPNFYLISMIYKANKNSYNKLNER